MPHRLGGYVEANAIRGMCELLSADYPFDTVSKALTHSGRRITSDGRRPFGTLNAPAARPENGRAAGWLSGGANLCGARALLAGLDLELDALSANEAVEVQ
jgi:hypothetical protein